MHFHQTAWQDLSVWLAEDRRLLAKIFDLANAALVTPFTGTGKPEALKGDKRGLWSRRINREHRLVYSVTDEAIIIIVSCRSQYD